MPNVVCIDASRAKSIVDIMDALKQGLGSPDWHGSNVNAFIDSLVYGGINKVNNATIIMNNLSLCNEEIIAEIKEFTSDINDAAKANGEENIILI